MSMEVISAYGTTVRRRRVEPLPAGVIHVWWASLDPPLYIAERLPSLLSPDEQERASRFVFAHYRDRWVAGRAFLRLLVSRYLNAPPTSFDFVYGEHGRPALARDDGDVRFNLAHSEGLAVCTLARGADVGVDVEHLRPMRRDALAMANSYFTATEAAELSACPPEARDLAFLRLWTRKEAVLKSTGEGLVRPLSSFAVSLASNACRGLDGSACLDEITLHEIEPEHGYVAAIAAPRLGWQIKPARWSW